MKWRLFTVAVIVALAGLTVRAIYAWRADDAPQVVTDAVTRGAIVSSISASGTVEAVTTVQVGSQISGSVQALYADFNSVVKKGQIVARLDPLELAGIRTEEEAARRRTASGPSALQITGPYRLVRHPIYLGWILIVFGVSHMTGDRLAFATVSSLYLIVAVPWEERSLRQSFGEDYDRYMRQVRWRVLPYMY